MGLVGADHVKFQDGIPARYTRMIANQPSPSSSVSVMLNPTLIDTRPSGSVSNVVGAESSLNPDLITLQLRYLKAGVEFKDRALPSSTAGVLPLSDYIIIG